MEHISMFASVLREVRRIRRPSIGNEGYRATTHYLLAVPSGHGVSLAYAHIRTKLATLAVLPRCRSLSWSHNEFEENGERMACRIVAAFHCNGGVGRRFWLTARSRSVYTQISSGRRGIQ